MHKEQNSIIKEAIKSHIKNWKASTATNAAETITREGHGGIVGGSYKNDVKEE